MNKNPVMLCFFAMGFVDLVGIASNYVQADLQLTDSAANIFSIVFSQALLAVPEKQNEVSGLMIMGVAYLLYYFTTIKSTK